MRRLPVGVRLVVVAALTASVLLAETTRSSAVAPIEAQTVTPSNEGGWVHTFGTNGVGRIHDTGVQRAVESDGRGGVFAGISDYGEDPVVVHVTPQGQEDTGYGDDGRAALPGFAYVYSLVRVGTRLVVVGSDTKPWDGPGKLRVMRLTARGLPDTTFHGGVPLTAGADVDPEVAQGALLADGRVAIAVQNRVLVVTKAGVFDPTVGEGGVIATDLPGRPAIVARGAGFVVGGHLVRQDNPNGDEDLFTIRLVAHSTPGVVDDAFGDDGHTDVADDRIPDEGIEAIASSDDGVIVATTGAVFRLKSDGSLDGQFPSGPPGVGDLALQDDGKIVTLSNAGIERLNRDGTPDTSFGSKGKVSAHLNEWASPDNGWMAEHVLVTGKLIQTVGMGPDVSHFDLVVATRSGRITGGVARMRIYDTRVFERGGQYDNDLVIELDRYPEQSVHVDLALIDKTASGLDDFGFDRLTVQYNFGPAQRIIVRLQPLDDDVSEPIEELRVRLVGADYALPGSRVTAKVLVNDDTGPEPPAPALVARADAYPGFRGGAFVAAGDLDGDGRAEVVTSADAGGGPHVRIMRADGTQTLRPVGGFFAYDPAFTGGVRVATGDVDGDGIAEIITAPGPGGGPHVRVWRLEGDGVREVASFMAGDGYSANGMFVAVGDYEGDGRNEVITAFDVGGPGQIYVSRVEGVAVVPVRVANNAYPRPMNTGTSLAVASLQHVDIQGDSIVAAPMSGVRATSSSISGRRFTFYPYGTDEAGVQVAAGRVGTAGGELLTTPASGHVPRVAVWSALPESPRRVYRFMAYEHTFRGGVRMAVGDVDGDGSGEVITAPGPGRATTIAVRAIPLH